MFAKSICAIVPVLVFSLFVLAQGARAGDPPTHPMLRIDIGLHHQSVNSIVTDADEKIFVTASADKTLKVWSAETGDLIRTLRLPIGSGAVESAIRRVINLRVKGPGMFWEEENLESAIYLRAQTLTGRWDEMRLRVSEHAQHTRNLAWKWEAPPMSIKDPSNLEEDELQELGGLAA